MKTQGIQSRAFRVPDDIERVRQFLFDMYRLTQSGLNWEIRRWEGQFYHARDITQRSDQRSWSDLIRIWETADGQIVGVAHPEDGDDVWLEIHPDHRDLENEMFAWAEAPLAKVNDEGKHVLHALQIEGDEWRADVLWGRGFEQTEWWAVQRWRDMRTPVPELDVAEGYTVRSVYPGDHADHARLATVIGAGFGRELPLEVLTNFWKSPSYNPDLILVAEAPDGSFASHAGVTYNPETGLGIFEPVCTHPDHRRKGLAKACMTEGLHRLKALGAVRATVGTGGTNSSNVLYEGLDFTEVERVNIWRKTW